MDCPTAPSRLRLLEHLAGLYAAPADLALARRDARGRPVRRHDGASALRGQKQRVALATALVGRPEVVFLDEPTAGLDPHGRLDVYDLIRRVRDEGTTVVVTTHSFEEAERLADHLVIVSEGRTVAEGDVASVVGDGSLEDVYFDLTRKVRR